jgi:hypothetical protein
MINFKQEQLIEEVLNYVTEKFPEVRLLNVTESPEDPESLWIRVTDTFLLTDVAVCRQMHTEFSFSEGVSPKAQELSCALEQPGFRCTRKILRSGGICRNNRIFCRRTALMYDRSCRFCQEN